MGEAFFKLVIVTYFYKIQILQVRILLMLVWG